MSAYPAAVVERFSLLPSEVPELSSKQSFFVVFSLALDITEEELAARLSDPSHAEVFDEFTKLEFAAHSRWIDMESVLDNATFIPVLAMVAVVSRCFDKRIILICDDLNLADFHQGTNGVVFNPSRVVGDDIVCWLTDACVFNFANFVDRHMFNAAIDSLPESSIIYVDSVPEAMVQVGEEPVEEIEEDAGVEAPVTFANIPAESAGRPTITIQEFLARFTGPEPDSRPTADAYSNGIGIDFESSDYRGSNWNGVEMEKTADIDGFFACIKLDDLPEVIKCGGTVIKIESVFLKNSINSIRKIALDATNQHFPIIKAVKFGFLNKDERMEVLFCFGSQDAGVLEFAPIVESAHQYAKEFPCIERGCPYSAEHRSLRSSRPLNLRQIPGRSYKWDYNARNFGCILRDVGDYVQRNIPGRVSAFVIVRAIGTKFQLMSNDPSQVHGMLDELLEPFDAKMFVKPGGPRAFVDFSLKFVPMVPGGGDIVRSIK